MSIRKIIESLQALQDIHHQLIHVSKEKTELIKEGKIDELQGIIANERKLVRKLEKEENERIDLVNTWGENQGITEELTITRLLELVDDEGVRRELEEATIELTKAMTDLKAQEKLNLALLNQSMEFVQLSLDLLSPSLKNMNYSNTNKPGDTAPNRSIFDSKA